MSELLLLYISKKVDVDKEVKLLLSQKARYRDALSQSYENEPEPTESERGNSSVLLALRPERALALHYIASLILRLPLIPEDIRCLALSGKLPYLNGADSLPSSLSGQSLGRILRGVLRPTIPISCDHLSSEVYSTADFFVNEVKLPLPAINAPLVFARFVHELLFPEQFYIMVMRLMVLRPYSWHVLEHKKSTPPWLTAMAVVVFVVKLCYGLDDVQEHRPLAKSNLGLPDWHAWIIAFETHRKQIRLPVDRQTPPWSALVCISFESMYLRFVVALKSTLPKT